MKFVKTDHYEAMSEAASEVLVNCLVQKPDALFCIATGSSPTEAYRLFVEKVKSKNIDTGKMRIIKLDEWKGLSKDNPATCEYYVQEHILKPLGISEDRYISFDPMEENAEYECERITKLLHENGGIDCCVLGLGRNGHLGLIEPADKLNPFVHKAVLDKKTQTHPMLAANHQMVSEGYTLGLADLLASKEILFVVTGGDKQEAYELLQESVITNKQPANYLWLHNNTHCIVDLSSFE